MTGAELKAISAWLLEMAEEFEGHTSNDWVVPATKENKAILEAAIEYNHSLEREGLEDPLEKTEDGEYFIWDDWLMRYLETRCNPGQAPLTQAEALLAAGLLEMIADDDFNLIEDDDRILEVVYLAGRCKGEMELSPAFAGPAAAAPESVPTAERPGVSERWTKSWKSTLRNHDEWYGMYRPESVKEMQYFIVHGEDKPYEGYTPSAVSPPAAGWEYMSLLPMASALNLWKWERAGVIDRRWDGEAAASAFLPAYFSVMTSAYRAMLWRKRRPDSDPGSIELELPFTALGFVLGIRDRPEQMARVQLAGIRKGRYDRYFMQPVSAFIARLLADYLGQAPVMLKGDPAKLKKGRVAADPVMASLFDAWRDPDPAGVAPRLVAACDIHTHQSIASVDSEGIEFHNGEWTQTPIAALLVLKLREKLGLKNPEIDHPLARTVVGRLPAEPPVPPEELLIRIEARMRRDGFSEAKVLPAYEMSAA